MTDESIEANFYQCLGRKLEVKRKEQRISQTELGRLVGAHRNTIMRWEQGKCAIDAWQLLRLADALSCNHLMLLPPKELAWGPDFLRLMRERDPRVKSAEVA